MLALTSSGRTFAYAITKRANTHGQLGFWKFDIPLSSSLVTSQPSRLHVELKPKVLVDTYARVSPFKRLMSGEESTPLAPEQELLAKADDGDIRFSDSLFEVKALEGVNVAQIAAGSRSSFARTTDGRLLAWGANEYG